MRDLEFIISAREQNLNGLTIRRLLPQVQYRMVGPFIFFDHIGPTHLSPNQGLDVRPHPHIHLATATYLYSGQIRHRDHLGSDQIINPGDLNWMIAGRGIVHSERTPDPLRTTGGLLNAVQIWAALPEEKQDVAPGFWHYSKASLPCFSNQGAHITLLLGNAFGHGSPAPILSDLFYMDCQLEKGAELILPSEGRDGAVYLIEGELLANGQRLRPFEMGVALRAGDIFLKASEESRFLLFGGTSIGPRQIDWNFVSTHQDNITRAKADWSNGPGSDRFPKIPGDQDEFIPLPIDLRVVKP